MQDMYSAGFYPYPDEESFWGYWSKQALLEMLAGEHKNIRLIRLNLKEAIVPESLGDRAVGINADIKKSIEGMKTF